MWLCPTCKSTNKDEHKRCLVCGRFPDQREDVIQHCSSCGVKYTVNIYNRYCINCGHKFEE